MEITYSKHWHRKRGHRKNIMHFQIEYALQNSNILKDKNWEDALNAM